MIWLGFILFFKVGLFNWQPEGTTWGNTKLSWGITGEFDCILWSEPYYIYMVMHELRERYSSFRSCILELGKTGSPLTDPETVKECMLAVMDKVINGDKIKTSVTSAIKNVMLPLVWRLSYLQGCNSSYRCFFKRADGTSIAVNSQYVDFLTPYCAV